jgi:nitroreductase
MHVEAGFKPSRDVGSIPTASSFSGKRVTPFPVSQEHLPRFVGRYPFIQRKCIMLRDLVVATRTYRRFDQSVAIDRATLEELVDLGRLSASGGNAQPLKYALACDGEMNAAIFPHLAWAGFLADWDGPAEGERPAGYIVILGDTEILQDYGVDHGIAAQSIALGATERGLGVCMIGSIQREGLREVMGIDERYRILLVLAVGKPAETVVIDDLPADGNACYYRDADSVHHVPKRMLDDVIVTPKGSAP